MQDRFVQILLGVWALALVNCGAAWAGSAKSVSPFMSASFSRTIHGDERAIDLTDLGRGFGRAAAFFGVDSLSTADRRYLTSGLQWRSGSDDTPLIQVSALRTEIGDSALGESQTLVRAENSLDLGGRWFLPDLTTELAQVSNSSNGKSGLGGRAARIGLAEHIGPARYNLGYFQADPQFNALGSSVVAGDRGLALESHYELGAHWRLAHDLRFHQTSALRQRSALAQRFVLSRGPQLTDVGAPWRFIADVGAPAPAPRHADRSMPIAFEMSAQTARWRSWRIDSSLGWYGEQSRTPLALPVQGTLWQVSASRDLNIAGLHTQVSPRLWLGGSRYEQSNMGARTGLRFGFADSIALDLDYLSSGWSQLPDTGNHMRMMLNFKHSTAGIMPGLRTVAQSLRLPWQRRR